MAHKIISGPDEEQITLEEARDHLRIVATGSPASHPDDAYIEALIISARSWCEQYLRRAIATKTIEMALDRFTDEIKLEMSPVTEILSIKYLSHGVEQTVSGSTYSLDDYNDPNKIYLKADQEWPDADTVPNAVKVRYIAGYTDSGSPSPVPLPGEIRSAMLLIIGHLYENRQEVSTMQTFDLPMGVKALLQPYRLGMGL
jgi:uncharacterized phiE125 gp8 family phage protein